MLKHIGSAFMVTVLLGSPAAYAGGVIGSGIVTFTIGDTIFCAANNIGTKDVSEATLEIYKVPDTTPETSFPYSFAAKEMHGVTYFVPSTGSRYCVVNTKGNAKSMRGTLCNTTEDDCTSMR